MPVIWFLLPLMLVNYAPVGAVRGLWIGPYLNDVFGLTVSQIGQATLVMGVAMIVGTLCYGPLDRILGTRKWIIFWGNLACAASILTLAALADRSAGLAIALMAVTGFFGASFPIIIAHARGFFPPHLTGRGVTLMNLFGIGGVSMMQFASGKVHTTFAQTGDAAAPYIAIFTFFGVSLALGVAIYAFSTDNMD